MWWVLQNILGGLVLLLLGAVVLFLTFWIVYGVTWPPIWMFKLDNNVHLIICTVFMVLLFVGNARTDREYLTEYSFTTGTFSDKVVTFYVPGAGLVSNINPLAPDSMHSIVKFITNCLYTGPRAITAALRMFLKAYRFGLLDVNRCAAVITFLHGYAERVPYQQIVREVPDLNPVHVFPQLANIDGVLFLDREPAGLSLSSELRAELDRARN